MLNVEKINSLSGCGECVFCLSKCPKCQTADVEIQYHRVYSKDGDVNSCALVACKCGRIVIETITHDNLDFIEGGKLTYDKYEQTLYDVPELTELFDKYFEDCKPVEQSDVAVIYRLENETEDFLRLNLDEITKNVQFEKDLPVYIDFKITGKEKHFEINVFEARVENNSNVLPL